MEDLYGKGDSPLICDSLCDKVKDAILGGSAYSIQKLKEKVHDITKGNKEDEE
tara:strand:+ start:1066 stop:1224 length:159 start_codon:yes stop_codon:yes gene_type:complete